MRTTPSAGADAADAPARSSQIAAQPGRGGALRVEVEPVAHVCGLRGRDVRAARRRAGRSRRPACACRPRAEATKTGKRSRQPDRRELRALRLALAVRDRSPSARSGCASASAASAGSTSSNAAQRARSAPGRPRTRRRTPRPPAPARRAPRGSRARAAAAAPGTRCGPTRTRRSGPSSSRRHSVARARRRGVSSGSLAWRSKPASRAASWSISVPSRSNSTARTSVPPTMRVLPRWRQASSTAPRRRSSASPSTSRTGPSSKRSTSAARKPSITSRFAASSRRPRERR